jgi:integrase
MDAGKIREAIAALQHALASEQARLTWAQLWELYALDPPVTSVTFDGYRHLWNNAVGPYFGERDVAATVHQDIAAYRQKRRGELTKRGKRAIRPATRNREVNVLRALASWGVEQGHLSRSPLAGLDDKEPEDNVRETVVGEDMLRATAPWLPPVVTAFVITCVDSGMRRKEAAAIRWDQVDIERGIVELSRRQVKGGQRSRITMLSARACELLGNLPRIGPYVFANPDNGADHYRPDFFLKKWRRACEIAGIQGPDGNVTLHDLRRTFATRGRRAGIQESELMAMGGWKTAEVFSRYNIVGLDDVALARKRAEAYLRKIDRIPPKKVRKISLTTESDPAHVIGATVDE